MVDREKRVPIEKKTFHQKKVSLKKLILCREWEKGHSRPRQRHMLESTRSRQSVTALQSFNKYWIRAHYVSSTVFSSEITAMMEESSLHASVGCDSSGRYEGLRKEADHNGGERESHQGRVNSLQKCPEEK